VSGKLLTVLVLAGALSSALVAGMFYAFSSFIMAALARVPGAEGMRAMNAINVTVITPSFMALFMGTALLGIGLAIWSLFSIAQTDSQLVLLGALLYVLGCFGVTMVFNVPLNDQLAAAAPTEALWNSYLRTWTLWNSVRTAAATLSSAVLVAVALRQAAA
jgi:uncharacterized membrane protein